MLHKIGRKDALGGVKVRLLICCGDKQLTFLIAELGFVMHKFLYPVSCES